MKCIICQNELVEKDLVDVPDARMCMKCWFDFRYGKYKDSEYKDFAAVKDEYNYIGMYPDYERQR